MILRRYDTREYWFELLIAVLAVAGMLELVVGRDSAAAPSTSLWFSIPAVAVLVLPLFLRRRFAFAAPGVLAIGRGAHIRRRNVDPIHRQPRRGRTCDRVP